MVVEFFCPLFILSAPADKPYETSKVFIWNSFRVHNSKFYTNNYPTGFT